MRYALYIRKSSEDNGKQIQSIENQEFTLKQKAEKEDLKIVKIYKESKSAKKPQKREGFNQMIQDLYDGKFDAILCWSLCRLSRNAIDGSIVQQNLLDGVIKEIVTYDRKYLPCDNSIILSLELGLAQEYSLALSKNTKRGQSYKLNKGDYPGEAPLGYLNTPHKLQGEKTIEVDPERAPILRKLWDLLLEGDMNVSQLTKQAEALGLRSRASRSKPEKKISVHGMYCIFTNPFYYGVFKWSGELHQGNHKPLITKEEFEDAQKIISSKKSYPRTAKYNFPFKGHLKCGECGASITGERKNKKRADGTINTRTYYRCTHRIVGSNCKQPSVREEDLEAQYKDLVDSITISEDFSKWSIKWLRLLNKEESSKEDSVRDQQVKRLQKIDKELSTLLDLRIQGEIEADLFKLKKDILVKEQQELQKSIEISSANKDRRIDRTEELLHFCTRAKILFESGSLEDKKLVLRTLGSHFYLKDKKLEVDLASPFKLVQDATKSGLTINPRFATLNTQIQPEFSSEEIDLIKNGGPSWT